MLCRGAVIELCVFEKEEYPAYRVATMLARAQAMHKLPRAPLITPVRNRQDGGGLGCSAISTRRFGNPLNSTDANARASVGPVSLQVQCMWAPVAH